MQEVMDLITRKSQNFVELPLFKFMQDRSIHPAQRLSFAPCMAHFVMGFSDLNKYVFRNEKVVDPIQNIINQHTYEDETHWPWYLTDIASMGLNCCWNFNESLEFFWSEETKLTRQLIYQLSGYALQADPIMKIAIIESLEAMGNVFFSISVPVVAELQTITQKEYKYFGHIHLCSETGHTVGTAGVEDFITTIQLTDSQRQEISAVIEKIFAIFSAWTDELLTYAKMQNLELAVDYKHKVLLAA